MMSNQINRREFLARATASAAGAALALTPRARAASPPDKKALKLATPKAEKLGWRVCCELYTFRDRTFYEALDVIAGLGLRRVEPGFFLPLSKERRDLTTSESLDPEHRREMKQRMDDLGISMPNYYAPLDRDQATFRKVFDFAKQMGVETLVAEPPETAFDTLEPLCAEYKINLAIHNHPKGSGSHYWDPDTTMKVCAGRGPRIGCCPDIGHWVRSGLDTLECLRKYQKRLITMHAKDAAQSGKRDSRDVPLGAGKANFTALLQQLYDWKWRGVITIEYEYLSPQLVPDVAQCIRFIEDFAAGVKR